MDADVDERSETQQAIMEATYRALRTRGYADLTIQAIADEFAKSKSLLYYHYDTKDDLLVDFLGYGLDRFAAEDAVDPTDSPTAQLETFLDDFLPASLDDEQRALQVALFELRSQAPMNEAYRKQFSRADRIIHETLAGILERGIEQDEFRDIDVDHVTELLHSVIDGGMTRRLTTADEEAVTARRALDTYIESNLLADE
jgi:AcrR family transcriptional regulator